MSIARWSGNVLANYNRLCEKKKGLLYYRFESTSHLQAVNLWVGYNMPQDYGETKYPHKLPKDENKARKRGTGLWYISI